jgi:CheY-like chemotaxis protein
VSENSLAGEIKKARSSRKLRILVVDDIVAVTDALVLLLTAEGHDVAGVYDGPTAIAACESAPPDVVLLDFQMPEMNGAQVAAKLYALPMPQTTKIVVHTSLDLSDVRLLGLRCDRLIYKTYSIELLLSTLVEVVTGHSG